MKTNILQKAASDIVTAYRQFIAKLFPMWCIRKKILKDNPYAIDYLPSLKFQQKAVEIMSPDEIEARCWSSETLQMVFHEKNIFFKNFSQMEFYNLITNKKSMMMAIDFGSAFSKEQTFIILRNIGLYSLTEHSNKCKSFVTSFLSSYLTKNGKECAPFIVEIANNKELERQYLYWLENFGNEPQKMNFAYIENMIYYLFGCANDFQNVRYVDAHLKDAYLFAYSNEYDNRSIWLSLAFNCIDNKDVYSLIIKNLDRILDYLRGKPAWKEEFIDKLISLSRDYTLIKRLYEQSDNKDHIHKLCSSCQNLYEINDALSLIETEQFPNEVRIQIGSNLIKNSLQRCETQNKRPYTTQTSASFLKEFLKKDAYWTDEQKEVAIRAIAAGGYADDEWFESLSDAYKAIVMEELEIFSQFSLVSNSAKDIIANKLHLLPEAEEYFFSSYNSCRYWKDYIDFCKLSDKAYKAMLECRYATIDIIVYHAEKHGITNWQYRTVLCNDKFKFIATQLKEYLKQ